MLGSIDCMHWDWKNCPKSLHGQFKRRDHKYPTLMLEAAADKRLWIWHAYFRGPGANNNLNVLYGSPLFDDEIADIAPECPFIVNGHTYMKCYYLADGIYPEWSTFVSFLLQGMPRPLSLKQFKKLQEKILNWHSESYKVVGGFEVNLNHMFVSPELNMVRNWVERCDLHVRKAKELRDKKTHIDLRQDFVEHLWNNQ
ncbi:ALP1-like protein isoform X1 [Tanacetum coccineum]